VCYVPCPSHHRFNITNIWHLQTMKLLMSHHRSYLLAPNILSSQRGQQKNRLWYLFRNAQKESKLLDKHEIKIDLNPRNAEMFNTLSPFMVLC
jgi:hypothetical protein